MVVSTRIFFQGAHLIFFWFISMTPNFFQAATLKKIWVEATLNNSQLKPYKNLGRFYRVSFKSLLSVQIRRAIVWQTKVCCMYLFLHAIILHMSRHVKIQTSTQISHSTTIKNHWHEGIPDLLIASYLYKDLATSTANQALSNDQLCYCSLGLRLRVQVNFMQCDATVTVVLLLHSLCIM